MKQNEKDLLVKDLCARLPYGVKVEIYKDEPPYKLKGYDGKDFLSDSGWDYLIEQCKPYLFPISSMTDEQKKEYAHILVYTSSVEMIQITGESTYDWLNKNMFDWRGLIPMGLAIDATNLNIY
jgi:hypothetical protein